MTEKDEIIFDSYVKGLLLCRDEEDLQNLVTEFERDPELCSNDLLRLLRIVRVWKVRH